MKYRSWLFAAILVAGAPAAGLAQSTKPAASPRFEVEVYGGAGKFFDAGTASLELPAAGAPIATSSPLFPSRRVSTWFFGDGSTLLNAVNTQLNVAARIAPLDTAIATIGRRAENGQTFGGRLRVRTAARLWTEIGVDVSASSNSLADGLLADVETTRTSFVSTFTGLLASGPFTNTSVTATATPSSGSWREVTTSLAANIDLGTWSGLTPYATVGAAYVSRQGTQASVSLEGRYRTRILGGSQIDETDRVTIRGEARNAPAFVAGGGVTRRAGNISLRLDARAIMANRTISASVDASPLVATSTPADYIESFTNPSIQFSNNALTGRRSTLSGDAFDHVDVTRSTRLQVRGIVTLGLAIRF